VQLPGVPAAHGSCAGPRDRLGAVHSCGTPQQVAVLTDRPLAALMHASPAAAAAAATTAGQRVKLPAALHQQQQHAIKYLLPDANSGRCGSGGSQSGLAHSGRLLPAAAAAAMPAACGGTPSPVAAPGLRQASSIRGPSPLGLAAPGRECVGLQALMVPGQQQQQPGMSVAMSAALGEAGTAAAAGGQQHMGQPAGGGGGGGGDSCGGGGSSGRRCGIQLLPGSFRLGGGGSQQSPGKHCCCCCCWW
jgi:hypothetical protein